MGDEYLQGAAAKRRLLHVPRYDKWDNVALEYHVDWPLHLLLTPQVYLIPSVRHL